MGKATHFQNELKETVAIIIITVASMPAVLSLGRTAECSLQNSRAAVYVFLSCVSTHIIQSAILFYKLFSSLVDVAST